MVPPTSSLWSLLDASPGQIRGDLLVMVAPEHALPV
jgi:hypothetical protein